MYRLYEISNQYVEFIIENWMLAFYKSGGLFEKHMRVSCLNLKCWWIRPKAIIFWYGIFFKWGKILKHMTIFAFSLRHNIEICKNTMSSARLWKLYFLSLYILEFPLRIPANKRFWLSKVMLHFMKILILM